MQPLFFEDLKEKVCVITGGGGIIGHSLAKGLASAGVITVILDISEENARAVSEEIEKSLAVNSYGFKGDVLDKESIEKVRDEINRVVGKVDILINCAGGNSPKATTKSEFITSNDPGELANGFFGLDVEGFRRVFDLNFLGTVIPTMVFTKDMLETGKGNIVNISSMNAFRPLTKIPAYSAAKASINNFTEWLAVHFAKANIRVNAIAPGFFLTNQNRFLLIDEQSKKLTPRGEKIINGTPMNRFGETEELQGTLLYLVSDLSKFVTGITIPVDGGFNAYSGV